MRKTCMTVILTRKTQMKHNERSDTGQTAVRAAAAATASPAMAASATEAVVIFWQMYLSSNGTIIIMIINWIWCERERYVVIDREPMKAKTVGQGGIDSLELVCSIQPEDDERATGGWRTPMYENRER